MSLTGIFPLLAGAAEPLVMVKLGDKVVYLNPTQYVKKTQPAPFDGYLVEPERLEKALIATAETTLLKKDLEIAQRDAEIAQLKQEKAEKQLAEEQAKCDFVVKGLTEKIADLDVWYRKPWFVATATAVLFIATGILIP